MTHRCYPVPSVLNLDAKHGCFREHRDERATRCQDPLHNKRSHRYISTRRSKLQRVGDKVTNDLRELMFISLNKTAFHIINYS